MLYREIMKAHFPEMFVSRKPPKSKTEKPEKPKKKKTKKKKTK